LPRKRPTTLLIPQDQIDTLDHDFGKDFHSENARLLFAVRALAQRINDRANEWLLPIGMTATKFNYLTAIYAKRDKGVTLNELSEFVHTSNASVTSMVDSLEREGLVKRNRHPDDRRSTMVTLTARGTTLAKKAFIKHHAEIDALMKGFSRVDRRKLLDLLVRLGTNFEQANPGN
jgi:DNA-binding MarR family transcriptional regulator